uniref:Uncharacterized protein n=1 Tax=Zea mays TaxID=4577 RepID=A0A804R631_MAIZE
MNTSLTESSRDTSIDQSSSIAAEEGETWAFLCCSCLPRKASRKSCWASSIVWVRFISDSIRSFSICSDSSSLRSSIRRNPSPTARSAAATSAIASDSASSSLPLLSDFTAAAATGFVREALGMVKRSPLPAPPLEMSPCRLLLRTASTSEEGEDTGEGEDAGGAGPLVLILTMAFGLGSGTPPPARSWSSGKNGHLGPLDRPAERDRSARYRFRSFSTLWRHCTPDLGVAVGNRPQRAVTALATSSQSAALRLPFCSASHLSRYASMSARVSSCVQHGGGSLRPEPTPPSPMPPPEEAAAAAAAAAAATGAARGGRSGDETASSLDASEHEEDMAGQLRRRRWRREAIRVW